MMEMYSLSTVPYSYSPLVAIGHVEWNKERNFKFCLIFINLNLNNQIWLIFNSACI